MALETTFCKKHVRRIISEFKKRKHIDIRRECVDCDDCPYLSKYWHDNVACNGDIIWIRGDIGFCPIFSKNWSSSKKEDIHQVLDKCHYCKQLEIYSNV